MLKALFLSSLFLVSSASAQVSAAAKPYLELCKGCTPAQAEGLSQHAQAVYDKFNQLERLPIRVNYRASYLNAFTNPFRDIELKFPSGVTARHAAAFLSHELGHQLFAQVLADAGVGAIQKTLEAWDAREKRKFTEEEWALVKGSCEKDYQLTGLYFAFHELAADTFAYFFHGRDPLLLGDGIVAAGYPALAANRYFDRELTDAEVLVDLHGASSDLDNKPYSALSQCKKTIHEKLPPEATVLPVLKTLAGRFKATWEEGCGVTRFDVLRDRIRQDLTGDGL